VPLGSAEAGQPALSREDKCATAMTRRDETLISEIERDLLDWKPLADLLRKCIVLGGRSGSVELRDWASEELRGYGPDDELPAYRTIGAPIFADAVIGNTVIKGQQISASGLPDFVREHISEELPLRHGVGELEALIKGKDPDQGIHISLPAAVLIGQEIDQKSGNPWQHTQRLYWSVIPATISGILDNIRTTLAQLVSELTATMQRGQDVPTPDQAKQAVQVAVNGRGSRVTVTTAQASGAAASTVTLESQPPPADETSFWTRSRKVGAAIVGLATIIATLVAVIEFVH
jgi:hypothetical protein